MRLKSHLRRSLNENIQGFRGLIAQTKKELRVLNRTDVKKANYVVHLTSSWANEGEKSTTTEHCGSLDEAIKKAEKKFKATNNNRSDVQADYRVEIDLKIGRYDIPKEYWEKYKERSKWQ